LPGRCVVGFRDVRLLRWLPFEADPTTIEAAAAVQADGTVRVQITDLKAGKAAAAGVVLTADHFPEPPYPGEFPLTNEAPCRVTPELLYRNLFHGPRFHGIRTLGRCGDEGLEATVVVPPRSGWFRSTDNPVLVTDPVLLDATMHVLGAWHLEQPDWTGRI